MNFPHPHPHMFPGRLQTPFFEHFAGRLVVAMLAALILLPLYASQSLWLGVGVAAAALVVLGIESAVTRGIAIPFVLIMSGMAWLQLVLALWLAQYFPVGHYAYDIEPEHFQEFIAYAVQICLALSVGLGIGHHLTATPFPGRQQTAGALHPADRERLKDELDVLFFMGLALKLFGGFLPVPGPLRFFVHLLQEMAFVAPMIRMLLGIPGWRRQVMLVFGLQLVASLAGAIFHHMMLWAIFFVFVYWARYRPGRRFLPVLIAGIIIVLIMQPVKTVFRTNPEGRARRTAVDRVVFFSSLVTYYTLNPGRVFERDNLADTAMRLNQGWILNRVLLHVPEQEPHCGFEILTAQGLAVLVPRVLMPDKYTAGGHEYFERFTGHRLFLASMGMGFAGEFYAAFGKSGGLAATLIYGLLFGMAFGGVQRLSHRSVLWWCLAAMTFVVAVKAEDTVGNAMNWAARAALVLWGVMFFTPMLKRILKGPVGFVEEKAEIKKMPTEHTERHGRDNLAPS